MSKICFFAFDRLILLFLHGLRFSLEVERLRGVEGVEAEDRLLLGGDGEVVAGDAYVVEPAVADHPPHPLHHPTLHRYY